MSPRLTLALDQGTLSFPDGGDILVDTPALSFDLTALDAGRVIIRHGFWPDAEAWAARGYRVTQTRPERVAAAIVALPRAKDQARAMIAAAAGCSDGPVIVDGAKTDGVDSILKDVRKRCTIHGPVNKAHGKLFWFDADADLFADWIAKPRKIDGFTTVPGVFSADGVDPASRMLLEHLPDNLGPRVADLGAGWGYLAAHLLRDRPGIETLYSVEADHAALDCARTNVTDPRAQFIWSDARIWTPPTPMSSVVMNPPFHTARAADPALGQAFIANAARILSGSGRLWLVANRHLPYEATLTNLFRDVSELGGDSRFKVLHAQRPKSKKSRA